MKNTILTFGGLALYAALIAPTHAGDIFVAKNGDDANSGSLQSPYRTISQAAAVAEAGDTVFIREGTYEEVLRPANSGSASNPIVFRSYQTDRVIITAMQALSGWTQDSGQAYRTQVDWDLGQKNLVLNGDTALDLARWPNNTDGDSHTTNALKNTGGSGPDVRFDAFLDYASGIPDIDWADGGSVFFYGTKPGAGWIAWKSFITSRSGNRLVFDLDKNPTWIRTVHSPRDLGDFYLEGVRGALDYQNEWYFNPTSQTLYVQLPDGAEPIDGKVQMRRREKTIDLNNRSYIEIRDLAVFGGSIDMDGSASNNLVSGVSSFYGNHTRGIIRGFGSLNQSVSMRGNNNRVENSEIGFGAGNGVNIAGNGNEVINSYVHHFNTLGSYDAVINTRGGSNTNIIGNTLTRGGRDVVQAFNTNSEYAYNDISFSNLIADDCGLIYTVNGPRNSTIHHNWLHDAWAVPGKNKAAGIYLDNNASNWLVHNNVVWNTQWSPVQINLNGTNLDIFNNTLLPTGGGPVMNAWHRDGTQFTNVRVWNNLSDDGRWEPQSDKQRNLAFSSDPFVDRANVDFRLRAGTEPVDYGREIAGITDGHSGAAPDAGAYERGNDWVAGVDWDTEEGPIGRCYGLPGESCLLIETPVEDMIFAHGFEDSP